MLGVSQRENADMTVYITQELRGRDFSDALSYGDLEIVIPAFMSVRTEDFDQVVERAETVLASFSEKDYLLLSGDPVCIGLSCAIAAYNNFGRYKVLRWDRLTQSYDEVQISLED
jgi:hypothetical protein